MNYVVICSTGELNVSIPFPTFGKARAFTLGLRKGVHLWDIEMDLDLNNFTHRGFRFGQILAHYCELNYISLSNLKSFIEVEKEKNQ